MSLGLRPNLTQFALLMLVNGFVGAMVGLERAVLPVIAVRQFHLAMVGAVLGFILSFGLAKAVSNVFAGWLADAIGRKRVLVAGWAVGVMVPLIILWAPSWAWIVVANALLGVNQGLCWSMTVNMKIDLVGPARRGLALGLNETAGYVSLGLAALASAPLASAYGLRTGPFGLAVLLSLAGLVVSLFLVKSTARHVNLESQLAQAGDTGRMSGGILSIATWRDRDLVACSQAGLVNNLNDAVAWGVLPLFFIAHGLDVTAVAVLASAYALSWGSLQLVSGALSDRWGRRPLIVAGMLIQGLALLIIPLANGTAPWFAAAVSMGIGTALVYPTLLAAVSDIAPPSQRASAVGIYRLWRDLGYAAGALLAGATADAAGVPASIIVVALLTLTSGAVAGFALRETLPVRSSP